MAHLFRWIEPMRKSSLHKRMYAVSLKGVGLIAGTMAYTRRDAINHFYGGGPAKGEWDRDKRAGYRTVMARVQIIRC